MKRILIRAGQSPFDYFTPGKVLVNDSIGSNSGNLVYAYGVIKTLMCDDDVEITPDYYKYERKMATQKDADEINNNYDCYIIPLADAFRDTFINSMNRLTKLIKMLKIPCYIIGAGVKGPLDFDLNTSKELDKATKAFVSAVLDKSAMVGVRGSKTSEYLSKLGFKEGELQTAIGCPSLYINGNDMHVRKTNITEDSKILLNSTYFSDDNSKHIVSNAMNDFKNFYYVPQLTNELKMLYLGTAYRNEKDPYYPMNIDHMAISSNRARFFVNVPKWIEFASDMDLSFGLRLHGNVAPILAGTPSFVLVKDSRMQELAELHGMAHCRTDQINEKTSLQELIQDANFHKIEEKYEANFEHYKDFYRRNGLKIIYDDSRYTAKNCPFETKIANIEKIEAIGPFMSQSKEVMQERVIDYLKYNSKRNNNHKKKISNLNSQLAECKKVSNKVTSTLTSNNKQENPAFSIKVRKGLGKIKRKLLK